MPEERSAEKCQPEIFASLVPTASLRNDASEPERMAFFAHLDAKQGTYLTASGTLTQFNAIVAAIHGSVLIGPGEGLLRSIVAAGLLLHVLAAFVLCWAARPIDERLAPEAGGRVGPLAAAIAHNRRHADDTFRSYRRGWRITLLAVAVSSAAAALFVLQALGFQTMWSSS